jgi:hypothetical protein
MKWAWSGVLLVPLALVLLFWSYPPDGDDAYHHAMSAVEQVRAWSEGATYPRYHRGWNGGTGSFAPTIYSPIPLSVQGGFAWMLGDGRRAVGVSLAVALLVTAVSLVLWSREPIAAVIVLAPHVLAVSLARSTTTEAWSLAAAATVLALAMPGTELTRRRGLGLAAGVFLAAGCQVGILLQLSWVLGAAWAAALVIGRRGVGGGTAEASRALADVASWGLAGLVAAAVLWLPAVVDARHLAVADLTSGPLDWRRNFLPDGSELGLLLTATAASLLGVALIVMARGERFTRGPHAVALVTGVVLATPLAAPLWHLPKMGILQFPWRFLGPTTLVAVLAAAGLRGRWRVASFALLLVPLALLPIRIGSQTDSVPVTSTAEELATIASQQWGLAPVLPSARGFYAPGFHRLESLEHLARQAARVAIVDRDASGRTWRVVTSAPGLALLPIQWWPEWRITSGGRELAYSNRSGLVAVDLEIGTFDIDASLEPSRSRAVGAVLSIVGLAALLILWIRSRRPPTSGTVG